MFTEKEINAPILTKFAWAMSRNKEYLSKYKEEKLVHDAMSWCIRNSVELIDRKRSSMADNKSLTEVFHLQQLSTICGAIATVGLAGTMADMNLSERDLTAYRRWFDGMVSDPWDIVDSKLAAKPHCYLNLLAAMLTFKMELLSDDKIEGNDSKKMKKRYQRKKELLVEVDEDCSDSANEGGGAEPEQSLRAKTKVFVLHILTQFGATERGKEYMAGDADTVDFLLHIVAELWLEMGPQRWHQMAIQMKGMLQCLTKVPADRISPEAAFSILCTLSRIPMADELKEHGQSAPAAPSEVTAVTASASQLGQLRESRLKVVNSLAAIVVKESRKKKGPNMELYHVLGLCSTICAHSVAEGKMIERTQAIWNEQVLSALTFAAKHYLGLDKWTEQHFLLKNHLQFFVDAFEEKKQNESLLRD